jgi:hypothetical protein
MGRFLAFRGNKQAFVEASRAAEKTAHTHILDLLLAAKQQNFAAPRRHLFGERRITSHVTRDGRV